MEFYKGFSGRNRGKNNNRLGWVALLNFLGKVDGVQIADVEHGNYQVERALFQHVEGVVGGGDLCKFGRIAQVEGYVLLEEEFVYSTVLFEHEFVVFAADEENLAYPVSHELFKRSLLEKITIRQISECSFHTDIIAEEFLKIERS